MTSISLVSINIITFNGARYIKTCLHSLAQQTYKNIEVNILDNNSQDDTVKVVKNLDRIYESKANTGFAKGHNMLIEKSAGEYIVMLNQDAWLDKNYIRHALKIFQTDKQIAAVQPKIYRYDFRNEAIVKRNGKPIIDATGLVMLKNRRVIARGQGQVDEGQFDSEKEVFGVDGAAPMFRRSALEDVKIPKSFTFYVSRFEILDEDFFMYKEDVDLSWRLRLYGWNILYAPQVIAYHERGSGESASTHYKDIIKERAHISKKAKALSWRNQRLMQVKNELPLLYFRHFGRIIIKEVASITYILLFERFALQSVKDFFLLLPRALKKRQQIMAHKKISTNSFTQWLQ